MSALRRVAPPTIDETFPVQVGRHHFRAEVRGNYTELWVFPTSKKLLKDLAAFGVEYCQGCPLGSGDGPWAEMEWWGEAERLAEGIIEIAAIAARFPPDSPAISDADHAAYTHRIIKLWEAFKAEAKVHDAPRPAAAAVPGARVAQKRHKKK